MRRGREVVLREEGRGDIDLHLWRHLVHVEEHSNSPRCGANATNHAFTFVIHFAVRGAQERHDDDEEDELNDVDNRRFRAAQLHEKHGRPKQNKHDPHGQPALQGE